MLLQRRSWLRAAAGAGLAAAVAAGAAALPAPVEAGAQERGRPQLRLRANPMFAFAPARIVLTAELVGGASDYEEYYCPKIEWDWGDGTFSEASYDCLPYERGKSEIQRRYTQQHTYKLGGRYEIAFRMKQGSKAVASARVTVNVRDGDVTRR